MSTIYEATFNALPVGATIVKREDRDTFIIQDINPTSASVTSRNPAPKDAVIGVAIDKIFAGIREAGLLGRYNEALDSGNTVHLGAFDYEDPRTPAGIFSLDLIPLSTNELLITFKNVTESVRTERRLLESEARFRAMTESSPDHIMRIDLDRVIQYINKTVPDLTIEEVLGTPVFNYVAERDQVIMRNCIDRVRESGNADSYVLEYRSKEGDLSLFETIVGPIVNDNNLTGFILYSRDITRHREAEDRMNTLSLQLLQAQENEQRRVAQELHDEVGGLLASIQISLGLIPEEQRTAVPQINDLVPLVDSLIDQVRSVTLSLRPNTLDYLGLEAAIKLFIEQFSSRTQIDVYLESSLAMDARFPSQVETTAYRLVQEALTNVARHSGVTSAKVFLSGTENALEVKICDKGVGFDVESRSQERNSLGLSGMRHRTAVLGGDLTITSEPDSGTTIRATLPSSRSFSM